MLKLVKVSIGWQRINKNPLFKKRMFLLSEKSIKTIKSITNSQYLDIIGLVIVLIGSIYLGYHKTEVNFQINSIEYVFPLWIFSIINDMAKLNPYVKKKNTESLHFSKFKQEYTFKNSFMGILPKELLNDFPVWFVYLSEKIVRKNQSFYL